jgi:GNAT superfamily N-acetyltransferase
MTQILSAEYKLRSYNPKCDRDALEEICANVYGGSDYLPKVAETYVNDPLCSFLALSSGTNDTIKSNADEANEMKATNNVILAVANYKRLPLQKSAWIEAVRTHPSHRNKGLASKLLTELIALSRNEDDKTRQIGDIAPTENNNGRVRTRVLTCTIESNKGMQRALEKVGFQRYTTIPTLSFAALKQLPGWTPDCKQTPKGLLAALELEHLISLPAQSASSITMWNTITSEEELLAALKECEAHGCSGYLPGLYEYIVPSPSRVDLKQSMEHGLVFTLNLPNTGSKDISNCDENSDFAVHAGSVIMAFTRDDRISSLKSQWVCSIVAFTGVGFEAALAFAHSAEVSRKLRLLQSGVGIKDASNKDNIDGANKCTVPFILVFDGAVPLDEGSLAHALPRVTDECVVFSYVNNG